MSNTATQTTTETSEAKKRVIQDLVALVEIGTPRAKKALASVRRGTYDVDISEFTGGRLDQLTDMIISLE
jgi:hypothetical protein